MLNACSTLLREIFFNTIQFRDFHQAANVSVNQLKYCVVIATWARIVSLVIDSGYVPAEIPDLPRLLKSVVGLELPTEIAKYIETIGVLKLATGANVAP